MPVKGWISKLLRSQVLRFACESCGGKSQIGIHHLDKDRSNNSPLNLVTLCAACHTKAHWRDDKKPWRRHSATCEICGKPAKRLGLCETHRTRLLRYGDPCLVRKQIGRTWQLVRDSSIPSGLTFRGSQPESRTGWTDCADSATPSFRKSRKSSCEPYTI